MDFACQERKKVFPPNQKRKEKVFFVTSNLSQLQKRQNFLLPNKTCFFLKAQTKSKGQKKHFWFLKRQTCFGEESFQLQRNFCFLRPSWETVKTALDKASLQEHSTCVSTGSTLEYKVVSVAGDIITLVGTKHQKKPCTGFMEPNGQDQWQFRAARFFQARRRAGSECW